MPAFDALNFARVTYRANTTSGADVALHLLLDPDAATVTDAWSKLSFAFEAVDPSTLEILVRHQDPLLD